MFRPLLTVGWLLVTLATMSVPASATTILELSKKPGSKTILNIGTRATGKEDSPQSRRSAYPRGAIACSTPIPVAADDFAGQNGG